MAMSSSQRVLRVGLIQAGKIIEERVLKRADPVTIGPEARNTFVMPASHLPASFSIFEHRNSQYHLVFTKEMQGRVRVGTSDVDFATLRQQDLAKKRGDCYVLPLTDSSKGKVSLGDLTLLFQFVAPPQEPVNPELPPLIKGSLWQSVDHLFFLILMGSLVVHFAGAGYLAFSAKVEEQELSLDELPDRFAKLILPPRSAEPVAAKPAATPESEKKEAKKEETAPKAPRPAGDPAIRRADIQQKVASRGLLKILGSRGSGGGGAFADVLGTSSGSGEIANALAGAGGVGVATTEAVGQGGARKGGGSGAVAGIGVVGTAGGGNVNLGAKGDAHVSGQVKESMPEVESSAVDRQALARYVRARLKAMQSCYEQELKRNPSLKGKIMVRFVITPAGRAGEISFEENTLGSESVSTCIRSVIRGWIFPFKPPDNVAVAYPFVFSPTS